MLADPLLSHPFTAFRECPQNKDTYNTETIIKVQVRYVRGVVPHDEKELEVKSQDIREAFPKRPVFERSLKE